MKTNLLSTLLCVFFASCTATDQSGRRWLSVPLPPDPLREFVIDAYQGRIKPPLIKVPVKSSVDLQPPPPGYMFSSERTSGGYKLRGVTGPIEQLSVKDYIDFSGVCKERGWKIYNH